MPLKYLDKTTDSATIIQTLRRDGAVAVKEVADHDVIDAIVNELRPRLDADDLDAASAFDGNRTLRTGYGLLTNAPSAASLVDHDLVIDVANSGDPIPEEDTERVFEPFVQSTARRSGPIKGSGLGLSVARECVEMQGGSLSLASHNTLSTCFRLTCPAR